MGALTKASTTSKPVVLVFMFHSTKFANRQPFAGGLQFFHTHVFAFARLQAFRGGLMGSSHGAVAGDVFFGFFVTISSSFTISFCTNARHFSTCFFPWLMHLSLFWGV